MLMDSLFLPAKARQLYRKELSGASLRIMLAQPDPEPTPLRLVAADVAARQHRRKTHAQKLAHNVLPEGTRLEVEIEGSTEFRARRGERSIAPRVAGGAG